MRLFIAINLSDKLKDNIEKSAKIVKAHSTKGSFPKRDNYHITLAFIGEIEESRIPVIQFIMDQCRIDTFPISIQEIASFRRKDGEIVHRKVEATRRLYNLQDKLARLLKNSLFDIEKRAFTPHITIARRVIWKKECNLMEVRDLAEMMNLEGAEYVVTGMDLMLSEHVSGGQKYSSLYHVTFTEKEDK